MTTYYAWDARKLLAISTVFLHLCMVVPFSALAQSLDVDGPTIVYADDEYNRTDTVHRFSLSATDVSGVKSVLIFHRNAGDTEFVEANMAPVAGQADRFEIVIGLNNTSTSLEYYIQAEDNVGNIVLKGFAFDPLVRIITTPSSASVAESAQSETGALGSEDSNKQFNDQQTDDQAPATSGKRKYLYIALGVLGAGLVAGLAGGGSSGGNAGDCTVDTGCRLTVNVPVPQ